MIPAFPTPIPVSGQAEDPHPGRRRQFSHSELSPCHSNLAMPSVALEPENLLWIEEVGFQISSSFLFSLQTGQLEIDSKIVKWRSTTPSRSHISYFYLDSGGKSSRSLVTNKPGQLTLSKQTLQFTHLHANSFFSSSLIRRFQI